MQILSCLKLVLELNPQVIRNNWNVELWKYHILQSYERMHCENISWIFLIQLYSVEY